MKKADIYQNLYSFLASHPAEIKEWVTSADLFLCDNGCKLDAKTENPGGSILITYTHRKSDKRICRIYVGSDGCKAYPYGHNFASANNILSILPESMLNTMPNNGRDCTGCATEQPDIITHSFRYTYKGNSYNKCKHEGFGFSLDHAAERTQLMIWLEMEVAYVQL